MMDAVSLDAAAKAGTDLTSIIGAAGGSGGAVAILAWLFVKGKLDSISILWKKLDSLREEIYAARLSDSKEYATRSDVTAAFEKLEAHIDKRFEALEAKMDHRGR